LIFTSFVGIGQLIFLIGSRDQKDGFMYMLAGRFVFGMGCEVMYVGQSVMLSKWFVNFELPIAMGFISAIPIFGSFASGVIVPI
jgi:MFS family permease